MSAVGDVLSIVNAYGVLLKITFDVKLHATAAAEVRLCLIGGDVFSIGFILHFLGYSISIIDKTVIIINLCPYFNFMMMVCGESIETTKHIKNLV